MISSWPLRKLGEVCDIVKDKPPKFGGTKAYYATGAINNNGHLKPEYIEYSNRPSRADSYPQIHDIGFAKMKLTKKVFQVNSELSESIFSTGFCFLRVGKLLNSRYLFYFIFSEEFQSKKDFYAGSGIMGGIKNSDIANIEIPLPSLSEQKRIVKILDEVFEKTAKAQENTEKNLQNSRELFESYLQKVFTNTGKDWEEKRLKDIGQTQTGLTPATSNKKYYDNFIPFIKPADVDVSRDGAIRYDNEGLSSAGLRVGRKIKKNSVLMVCIGASIGKVGFSEVDVSCNQQINTLTPASGYNPKFFYYAFRTKDFFTKVIKNSSQATLPIINKSKWENLQVAFPKTIKEQDVAAEKLDMLLADTKKLEDNYEQKLIEIGEFKKSILKMAFTNLL